MKVVGERTADTVHMPSNDERVMIQNCAGTSRSLFDIDGVRAANFFRKVSVTTAVFDGWLILGSRRAHLHPLHVSVTHLGQCREHAA